MSQRSTSPTGWQLGPALAAWVLPGLGHVLVGQRKRGLILGATIMTLWLAGLLVGGVSVLDREQHPIWFLGQQLASPSVMVNLALQHQVKPRYPHPPMPHEPHAYEPSIGRANEQGVLFTALAGLLNLLAILDVVYREPQEQADTPAANSPQPASGGGRS